MARKKSINDIDRQVERINRLAGEYNRSAPSEQESKVQRAVGIAERYVRNIAGTRKYQNGLARANSILFGDRPNSGDESYAAWQKNRERKYSQRTYMGLNAG